ncbi:WXG100-like domain-containing protein [Catenuloplanes japonicus]|uniref:WXG100-like domain-containing protein n=1 Tax=Catenuloplanes japonicus TaxID=33876 RepID=UPI0005242B10|nr:hypothetical protein [Catenuloplanes japonicus]
MGLELPGELVTVLGWLGYEWPDADETALFEMGQAWIGMAGTLESTITAAEGAAGTVQSDNAGPAMQAFGTWWTADGSPVPTLGSGVDAATALGAGLLASAAIVLALKIQIIVQLILLAVAVAQAIAAATVSFGASLLVIPLLKEAARMVVGLLIDQAIAAVLGG